MVYPHALTFRVRSARIYRLIPKPWATPADFASSSAPACRVKRGRTAVLAITNPTSAPVTFRLQGHHFRLLDRLDDGWKPFWLDTLLLTAGSNPADRVRCRIWRAMADGSDPDRLGRASPRALVRGRIILISEIKLVVEIAEYGRAERRADPPRSVPVRTPAPPRRASMLRCRPPRTPARLAPASRDHSGQHIAGPGGGKPRRRVGRDGRAAVR